MSRYSTRVIEPFMLDNYRFLPVEHKKCVGLFIDLLNEPHKTFAVKRYVHGMTYNEIAQELGYVERNLYHIREKVISLWNVFIDNPAIEKHIEEIIKIIQKNRGSVKHRILLWNMNIYKKGMDKNEFERVIKIMIDARIISVVKKSNGKGRPGIIYNLISPSQDIYKY